MFFMMESVAENVARSLRAASSIHSKGKRGPADVRLHSTSDHYLLVHINNINNIKSNQHPPLSS